MEPIRAFVGHSFSKSDYDVVSKFLRFFDHVARLNTSFFWEHAENAEPKDLADKVKAVMKDKNTLIAICTRKEQAIAFENIRTTFLPRVFFRRGNGQFSVKTSDWIIQEIGFALGRDLKLILLIEDGVRLPGRLQGDIEHIPFARSAPEQCFEKIMEMISALSPSPRITAAVAAESPAATATPPLDYFEGDDWKTPSPDWTMENFLTAMIRGVLLGDDDAVSGAKEALFASALGASTTERTLWEVREHYYRLISGRGGDIAKMKSLAAVNPHDDDILSLLANAQEHFQNYREAGELFERASQESKTPKSSAGYLSSACIAFEHAGDHERSKELLKNLRNIPNADGEVLQTLRAIAHIQKDDDVLIPTLERSLEINPSNNTDRFALGYKYSEHTRNALAIFHYGMIPVPKREAMAWNNLGVALNENGLSAKSVAAYRESEKLGGTLAMSNLANKLIAGGFLEEARNLCEEALKLENFHKNVAESLAVLTGVPESETKTEAELIAQAARTSEFIRRVGRAMSLNGPIVVPGRWQGADSRLEVTVTGDQFLAAGEYGPDALQKLLEETTGKQSIEYEGRIIGGAIVARVRRKPENSWLVGQENDVSALMIAGNDGHSLHVIELLVKREPQQYELRSEN